LTLHPRELSFFPGFNQLGDQLCHLPEANPFPATARLDRQRRGHVRLPGPWIPDQNDRLPVVEIRTRQLYHQQRFNEGWA
jgi:hypothetical protein